MVTAQKTPATPAAGKPAAVPVPKATAKVATAVAPLTPPKAKAPVKAAAPTKSPSAPAAPAKVKKPKLVRDGFTIPKAEYVVLDALKLRAAELKNPSKKSELLRAGIKALAAMDGAAFLAALNAAPAIKTGRPSQS